MREINVPLFLAILICGMFFVVGADNVFAADCQNWTAVANIGGVIKYDPAIAASADDKLIIAAVGTDDSLWINEFNPQTNQNEWYSLGGVLTSGPNLVKGADGKIRFSGIGGDNFTIWQRNYSAAKSWTEWQVAGTSGFAGIGPKEATSNGLLYRIVKSSGNSLLIQKCVPQLCVPGSFLGCKICDITGDAWRDYSLKCAKTQVCDNGVCKDSSRKLEIFAGFFPYNLDYRAVEQEFLDYINKMSDNFTGISGSMPGGQTTANINSAHKKGFKVMGHCGWVEECKELLRRGVDVIALDEFKARFAAGQPESTGLSGAEFNQLKEYIKQANPSVAVGIVESLVKYYVEFRNEGADPDFIGWEQYKDKNGDTINFSYEDFATQVVGKFPSAKVYIWTNEPAAASFYKGKGDALIYFDIDNHIMKQADGWLDLPFEKVEAAIAPFCENSCVAGCNAKTCSFLNYECGNTDNGCGSTINCGVCASGKTCSSGRCVDLCLNSELWDNIGGFSKFEPSLMESNGKLIIAAVGTDNALWINEYDPGNKKGEWYSLGGVLLSRPSLAKTIDKKISLSASGDDGGGWTLIFMSSKNWTKWKAIGLPSANISVGGSDAGVINGITYKAIKKNDGSAEIKKCIADICTPKTCATLGNYQCGDWNDGCGATINCGACESGKKCNSSGQCVSSGSGGGSGGGGGGTTEPQQPMTREEILQKIAEIKQLLIQLIIQLITELQKQLAGIQNK